jgi:N-acyl-phosphatidylethanolamine-hydrolysing phospholipase D
MVGPARFTPAPCRVDEIPEIDAIVISHNHYDRKSFSQANGLVRLAETRLRARISIDLDVPTLRQLLTSSQQNTRPPHLFIPLNTTDNLPQDLKSAYPIHEFDWWESKELLVQGIGKVRITSTPAQHFTGRGLFDRNCALWSSWAFEEVQAKTGQVGAKVSNSLQHVRSPVGWLIATGQVWFGGDTGNYVTHKYRRSLSLKDL